MVLPHSSTQKYLFTLGGQFAAARGGQYDRLLHLIAVYAIKNSPNQSVAQTQPHIVQYTHYSADGQLTPQATELLKDFYLAL